MTRQGSRLSRIEKRIGTRSEIAIQLYNQCIIPILDLFKKVVANVEDEALREQITRDFANGVNVIAEELFAEVDRGTRTRRRRVED